MVDVHRGQTTQNATIQKVKVKLPIRLVIYGGARSLGDNGAFMNASKNVISDYKNDLPVKSFFLSQGMKQLVKIVNEQESNSIQSLDIFCHGSDVALYAVMGVSLKKSMTYEYAQKNNLVSCLYINKARRFKEYSLMGGENWSNAFVIPDLKFSNFTNESKIEIHGCNTAFDGDSDTFSSVLSEALYQAGKKKSIVIGHTDFASPNRGGTKDIAKQDYRHGERAIFNNGRLLQKTRKEGRISATYIKQLLGG